MSGAVADWAGRPRRGRKRHQIASHFADDVSPRLRQEQLLLLAAQVRREGWTKGQFVVRCRPQAGEFTAEYAMDDVTLRLTVALPDDYPLRRAKVTFSAPAGVDARKWRRWELQLLTLLAAHNGHFADAVRIWKRNIDKEFEGVEPCPVCYSVISLGDKSLPRMTCSVCRSKFHSSCLFRWFQSSGDSKCPMCRSSFY
ncbi:hypothetical protein FNF28_00264 [Cafeteria roenbergensis]|nr:hypothetical protein FNF28_00264 [Cafeteria roenbergensis]